MYNKCELCFLTQKSLARIWAEPDFPFFFKPWAWSVRSWPLLRKQKPALGYPQCAGRGGGCPDSWPHCWALCLLQCSSEGRAPVRGVGAASTGRKSGGQGRWIHEDTQITLTLLLLWGSSWGTQQTKSIYFFLSTSFIFSMNHRVWRWDVSLFHSHIPYVCFWAEWTLSGRWIRIWVTQAPCAFWLQLILYLMISVSLISLTTVLCHQTIKSDTEARSSLEMTNCSLEHVYKAVGPDKTSNPFSILESVLMT